MNKKRILIGAITGAILGVFCIVGANVRFGGTLSNSFLFWFWFNRLLMGVVFGLIPACTILWRIPIRGVIIGLLISLIFYSTSGFVDLTGFLVGGLYGIIIEFVLYYTVTVKEQSSSKNEGR
ncbi:hypothetical protein [Candidatus Xianfuyuplasma coldseepsis]|uniref:Uncharacterized protein n=1 Tax=Candidatus Xianfuyuplasma coldseepsis TaxID=2782163 RepID=A0A7L7KPV6_9MOLU|nr:hypothetical protein [Xianfuyuplasma coldseepsis]QMS84605.1 hypothetical protein G4Z02_02175 [Xianfuyuplasma coldseepsis]